MSLRRSLFSIRTGYSCLITASTKTTQQFSFRGSLMRSISGKALSDEVKMMDIDSINKEYKTEIDSIMQKYEDKKLRKQNIVGIVTSTKASKSITVTYFHDKFIHKYNATISVRRKIMAHDEEEVCSEGDLVRVVPCAPVSRRKRHKLIDVIKKAEKLESTSKRPLQSKVKVHPKKK